MKFWGDNQCVFLCLQLSQDGGLEWREVLKGPHMFAFGDHGGLIVAVKQMEDTGELM
jgi:hypothetical protein